MIRLTLQDRDGQEIVAVIQEGYFKKMVGMHASFLQEKVPKADDLIRIEAFVATDVKETRVLVLRDQIKVVENKVEIPPRPPSPPAQQ